MAKELRVYPGPRAALLLLVMWGLLSSCTERPTTSNTETASNAVQGPQLTSDECFAMFAAALFATCEDEFGGSCPEGEFSHSASGKNQAPLRTCLAGATMSQVEFAGAIGAMSCPPMLTDAECASARLLASEANAAAL